jgi:hypothetical protein
MKEYGTPDLRLTRRCLAQIRDIASRAAGWGKPEDMDRSLQELAELLTEYWSVTNFNIESPKEPLQELNESLAALNILIGGADKHLELQGITRTSPYHLQINFHTRDLRR